MLNVDIFLYLDKQSYVFILIALKLCIQYHVDTITCQMWNYGNRYIYLFQLQTIFGKYGHI